MIRENACPKCHGTVRLEENEDRKPVWKCLLGCNKETSLEEMEAFMKEQKEQEAERQRLATMVPPPKPDLTGLSRCGHIKAMHQYYETNKAAILAQIEKLGATETWKRWDIPSGTMTALKHAWGLPVGPAPIRRKKLQAASVSTSDNGKKVTKVDKGDSAAPVPLFSIRLTIYSHVPGAVKVVTG